MSEQAIKCPKCGEENMAADVRCWACDAELRPAPEAPAPAKPAPQPPPTPWLTAAVGQLLSRRNLLLPPLAGVLLLAVAGYLSRAAHSVDLQHRPESFFLGVVVRLVLAAICGFLGMRFIFAAVSSAIRLLKSR